MSTNFCLLDPVGPDGRALTDSKVSAADPPVGFVARSELLRGEGADGPLFGEFRVLVDARLLVDLAHDLVYFLRPNGVHQVLRGLEGQEP